MLGVAVTPAYDRTVGRALAVIGTAVVVSLFSFFVGLAVSFARCGLDIDPLREARPAAPALAATR
jgi:hypothetical protein